jgi:hypothetical protein
MGSMVDTVYRLIPQKDRRISVEMAKPGGRRRVIPDFRDRAEAEAWIIQTARMIRIAHPIRQDQRENLTRSDQRLTRII